MVGFIFPPYLSAVNLDFHHVHFIDEALNYRGACF